VRSERRDIVFIVRMWSEARASAFDRWHGMVQDVQTGRKLYVTDLSQVAGFIAVHLTENDIAAERLVLQTCQEWSL
jgi:hypothetical protein